MFTTSSCYSTLVLNSNQDQLISIKLDEKDTLEEKPKNKRQRLSNLSQDEKLIRRKLKNRVAAQNARDRKKLKMENLEREILMLKEQNNRLKQENYMLKENSKILINENIKLTNYKQTVESSKVFFTANENIQLEDEKSCVEVVRSAVSVSRVSLPKKLLQKQIFQILFWIIMWTNLNLMPISTHIKDKEIQSPISMNPRFRLRKFIWKIMNPINVIERGVSHLKMKKYKMIKTKLITDYQLIKKLMMKRMMC